MKPSPTLLLKLSAFVALLVCAASPISAQTPEVLKVDPPSWFVGHSINPGGVFIRGRNLTGAQVVPTGAGLRGGPATTDAAGTYIFADVQISPAATPGARRLRITTANGSADAPFEVLKPLPRAGRFQGF